MNRLRTKPIEHSPLALPLTSGVVTLNIALAAVSLLLLAYYVVQSNDMAVQVWRSRDAQSQLATLRDARNGLVARQASMEDRQQLLALAQEVGMVPAGSVVYLVQDQPVAAR